MGRPFRAIAWGGGLPSTTMVAMSIEGDLPAVDAVLHCDPGWERQWTRETVDDYSGRIRRAGGHVEVLETGDIKRDGAGRHLHMPLWTATGGPLRRECTGYYKMMPQRRRVRQLLGYDASRAPAPAAGAVEQWLGFTWEEWKRARPSSVAYIVNRWPLLELRMTRTDCADYLQSHGYPVPRPSACVGCPYRAASSYAEMRDTCPDEFAQAVEFDRRVRCNELVGRRGGSTQDEVFVYSRGGALEDADFDRDAGRERAGVPLRLWLPAEVAMWLPEERVWA